MPVVLIVVAGAALLFFGVLAGAVMGAFAGWLVGAVFHDTMRALLSWLMLDVAPWQFGAMLGFIGSFFRTTLSAEKKK